MLKIGRYNTLKVLRSTEIGLFLDAQNHGSILIPKRYVPTGTEVGDDLEVFIYFDSEDRIIATTEKPKAQVGHFAALEIVAINNIGAFLDWGLPKDLLLPYREQKGSLRTGQKVLVYIYFDGESRRLVATQRIEKYLPEPPYSFTEGQEVNLQIIEKTNLGYKALINNEAIGLLYKNEVFTKLEVGTKTKGFIKVLRPDEKIDLVLNNNHLQLSKDVGSQILDLLKQKDGFLPLHDKSPAEQIYSTFSISKKTFKNAIGHLYKQQKIRIEPNGIYLILDRH